MKQLQRLRRAAKSKHGGSRLWQPWGLGCALGLSVLLGLPGPAAQSQEQPGARRGRLMAVPPPGQKGPIPDDYTYNVQGRRDPLDPLIKPEKQAGPLVPKPPTPGRALGPLERFDLSALKLTGIVWGERGRTALIKAPDGKSYFALLATYMGKYSGKVIAIENDHLVIEEEYLNDENKVVPKTLTIPLRRKKEG